MLKFTQFFTEVTKTISYSKLKKDLKAFEREISKKDVARANIVKLLNQSLRSYDVTINQENNQMIPSNQIFVSALFDPELDEDGEPSIELTLLFNAKDKKLTMEPEHVKEAVDSIIKAMMHEYIHRMQYQKRDYVYGREFKSDNKDKKYYGNTDEVEAFANNIAQELLDQSNGNAQKAKGLLRNFERTSSRRSTSGNLLSPDFHNYVKYFGTSSPTIKRLVKRIYYYLENIED